MLGTGEVHVDMESWAAASLSTAGADLGRGIMPLGELGVMGTIGVYAAASQASLAAFGPTLAALRGRYTVMDTLRGPALPGLRVREGRIHLISGPADWDETPMMCDPVTGMIPGLQLNLTCQVSLSELDELELVLEAVQQGHVVLFVADDLTPLLVDLEAMNASYFRLALPEATRTCELDYAERNASRACDFAEAAIVKLAWVGARSFFSPRTLDLLSAFKVTRSLAFRMVAVAQQARDMCASNHTALRGRRCAEVEAEDLFMTATAFRAGACWWAMQEPDVVLGWLQGCGHAQAGHRRHRALPEGRRRSASLHAPVLVPPS